MRILVQAELSICVLQVIASYGHVRDLPSKSGSVDPDNDFHMAWTQSARGRGQMKEVQDALKGANHLLLATDPDRYQYRKGRHV